MSLNEEQKRQIAKQQKFEETNRTYKVKQHQSNPDLSIKKSIIKGIDKKDSLVTPLSIVSTQATTPNLATILEQRRKVRDMEIEISPEVAAIVVKQYLLPMFQADNRSINDKKRKIQIGKNPDQNDVEELQKALEPVKGTVLEELKLSDKLLAELKAAKQELRETKQKLKDLEQSLTGMKEQIEQANGLKTQADVDLQLINYQSNLNYQENSLVSSDLIDQLESLNQKYLESENRRQQFATLLHNEKAQNDKLNNKANELEHGNALLRMENDIMGERLRNLYKSINEILNRKYLEEKLQKEISIFSNSINKLLRFHSELIQKFSQSMYEKDKLQEDLAEMTKYRKDLIVEHNRMVIKNKDKIQKLESSLEHTKEENISLTLEVTDLNKRNADLSQQYDQLRTKMKQYKSRFNKYAVSEEKICKNCNKYFVEKENFNWSCNTHHSQWNEDNKIFFCCGETNQGAIGCRIQKHESKDDEDEEDLKEKEELDKKKSLNIKCTLCNEIGHKTTDCIRDPNIRQNYEIGDELDRIETLKSKKKNKNRLGTSEIRRKVIEEFEQKFDQAAFGISQVTSLYPTESEYASFDEFMQQSQQIQSKGTFQLVNRLQSTEVVIQKEFFKDPYVKKKGFLDILEAKLEPTPQNSLVKIEIPISREYLEVLNKNKSQKVGNVTTVNELCKFVSGIASTFYFANESMQDNTKQSEISVYDTLQPADILIKKKLQEDINTARTNDDHIVFTKTEFQSEAIISGDLGSQENTKELEANNSYKIRNENEEEVLLAQRQIRKSKK